MRVSNHRTVDFFQLIKFHKYDWLMILFLAIIEGVILLWIPPFYRFVGKEMMSNLRYPFRSNTVPFWSVPIYSTLGPILIFLIYYFRKRDIHDLHHAILGLFFSLLLNAVITDVIKIAVGWPRPNFFWRCFPDGKEVYHSVTHKALCTGSRAAIREGHKSFPSGHTSWTYAGLGYLSWYLSGKLNLFDRKGHAAKLCIVFLLLMLATLVAISRVDDYWHSWQDVFVGAVIGLTMATCSYRQFFPAPYHAECTLPYPFFPLTTNQHAQEIERAGENEEQVGYDNKSLDVETGRRGGETTRNASPTNVKEFNISGRGSDM